MAEKTFEQWEAKIKAQGLHLRHDHQLEQINLSLTNKIPRVQQDLNDILRFPDAKRKEIYDSLISAGEIIALPDAVRVLPKPIKDRIDAELQHELDYYQTKWQKLSDICTLIAKEQEFRETGQVVRNPKGTTYYIDFDNGDDTNHDGTATTASPNGAPYPGPWATLDKFCENARSAGDKAIVRRGMTQTVTSDLTFTTDGTIVAPIILEADYDDAFGDKVDLSGTATATLTFGSKTVTFSADISGVLSVGDWIYASGDATREFAYEVASVATEVATLYLPYKGGQAGSGKTMYNMKAAPIWNTAAGNYEVNIDGDHYWKFQGLHFRGTDLNGVVEIDSAGVHIFKDCILEGNGAEDSGIYCTDDSFVGQVLKCRFYNYATAVKANPDASSITAKFYDCLFDGNSVGASSAFRVYGWERINAYDCEFKNHGTGDIWVLGGWYREAHFYGRNLLLSSATEVDSHHSYGGAGAVYLEDHDQVVGDNRQLTGFSTAEGTPSIQSETTAVRSGGGSSSIKCTPSDKLASTWESSRILLFEYPVYAVADAELTFTVYFKSDDDTDWDADPLNTELWVEAEYWGHATNKARKITKSTGVCNNFDADDTVWDSLTVTVTPLQTGVLYLRGYYCKTKEDGKSNIFYTDTKVGIA